MSLQNLIFFLVWFKKSFPSSQFGGLLESLAKEPKSITIFVFVFEVEKTTIKSFGLNQN